MSAPVVALFGPTASGKSAVALALAELVGGEIVSCDAMQLYAGLPILSNQPAPAELDRVPHHLVGIWPLDHLSDLAQYAVLAHAAIDDVLARGRVPIVAGGTGLYLRAALGALDLPPEPPPGLRERIELEYDRAGAAATHARLAALDPAAARVMHPNDKRRVVRALELEAIGSSLRPSGDELWEASARLPTRRFGLWLPRATLHARIEARTRAQLDGGAVAEVRAALQRWTPSTTAEQAHGLADIRALLAGQIDRATCEARLNARVRQYAKRQETWMRRIPQLEAIDGDRDPARVAADVVARLGAR